MDAALTLLDGLGDDMTTPAAVAEVDVAPVFRRSRRGGDDDLLRDGYELAVGARDSVAITPCGTNNSRKTSRKRVRLCGA